MNLNEANSLLRRLQQRRATAALVLLITMNKSVYNYLFHWFFLRLAFYLFSASYA